MNEEDLRDCFAMLAMTGMLMNGKENDADIPLRAYQFADIMLEARKPKEPEAGIASVKRTRKTK